MVTEKGTCPSFASWVEAFADGGSLLDEQKAHGLACSDCRERMKVAEALAAEMKVSERIAMPRALHGRIMGRIRRASWSSGRAWSWRFRRLFLPALVSATATLLLVMSFGLPGGRSAEGTAPTGGQAPSCSVACLWGTVRVGRAQAHRLLDRAAVLDSGEELRLEAGGQAVVRWGRERTVLLEGPCRYRPGRHEGDLALGRARFSVSPGGEAFSVRLPDGRVTVLGTRFSLSVDEGGGAAVEVDEGRVRVDVAGISRQLRAGETWRGDSKPGDASPSRAAGETKRVLPTVAGANDREESSREAVGEEAREGPPLAPTSDVSDEPTRGPHTVREGF